MNYFSPYFLARDPGPRRPGTRGWGPKTAICAALVIWFCVYIYCGVLNAALFGIPTNFLIIGFVWGLVEYALAAIAGAWLYRE